MEIYICSVISTVDGAVCTNLAFYGEEYYAVKEAEKCFVDMVKNEINENFTDEEMEDIITNGYAESNNLYICISHPTMSEAYYHVNGNRKV